MENYRISYARLRYDLAKDILNQIKGDESFKCPVKALYIADICDIDDADVPDEFIIKNIAPVEIFNTGECVGADGEPYGLCEFTTPSLIEIFESLGRIK